MQRSHRVINGFAVDLIGQFITQFLTFVSIPYIIANTSQSNYGFWLTIGSIMTWISITDLGIGTAMSRQLIKIQTQFSGPQLVHYRNELLSTSFFFFLLAAMVFFMSAVLVYPNTLEWFHISIDDHIIYRNTYFLASLGGAISLPLSLFGGILEANQQIVLHRNISSISSGINILFSVIGICLFKDVQYLSIALLLTVIIKAVISYFFIRKNYQFSIQIALFSKHNFMQLFKYGGNFQLAKLANTVASNTDNVFIGSYLGLGLVPIYSFTSKLFQTFAVVLVSKIPSVLFPGLSEIFDQDGHGKIQFVFNCLIKLLFRIGLFASVFTLLFNHYFVRLWVGEYNYGGDYLNWVFVYLIFYETIFRGTAALILVYGDMANWALASLFEAIFNVILSILLINDFGLIGIALATAISRTLSTGVYLFYYFIQKKLLNKSLINVFFEVLLKSTPTFLYMVIVQRFISNYDWMLMVFIGVTSVLINILTFDIRIIWKSKNEGWRNILSKVLYN